MKMYPKKIKGGYITGYFVLIGSKEAREAGFVTEEGETRELRKAVDPDGRRIIIELAEEPEEEEDPE